MSFCLRANAVLFRAADLSVPHVCCKKTTSNIQLSSRNWHCHCRFVRLSVVATCILKFQLQLSSQNCRMDKFCVRLFVWFIFTVNWEFMCVISGIDEVRKVWVTYGLFQGAIFQCTPFCKREAFAMVVVLKCFQCGSPFAEANLSCLQCINRCYIDHDPPSEPSVFIHEWKDWTVKLLVRQIYRAKWTAYGAALKKIKSGKICTRTLCMSALGLLGDVWCQTNVRW